LVEYLEGARRAAETDRLRSALLTSISHDLKTPLAAALQLEEQNADETHQQEMKQNATA